MQATDESGRDDPFRDIRFGAPHGAAGKALRQARENLGLTIDDVAQETRVPTRFLRAIEACEFTQYIAPVYLTGYARAFARCVSVPEDWVVNEVRTEMMRHSPTRAQPEAIEDARRLVFWRVTVALAIAAGAVATMALLH